MYIKWLQIGNNHFEFKKRSVSLRNVLKSVFSKKVSAAVLTAVMLFVSVFSMSMIASAASFSPRLSAPSSSNKYYYSNLNVFYKYGYGMPNCTAYAYGRAYEIPVLSQSFHGTMPSSGTVTTSLTATISTARPRRSAQLPAGHITVAAVMLLL